MGIFIGMTKEKKQTGKILSQHLIPTPSSVEADAPLSPYWAFVVQFRALPGRPAYPAGRVEHLASGRTIHFQSMKELSAYLTAELQATENLAKR